MRSRRSIVSWSGIASRSSIGVGVVSLGGLPLLYLSAVRLQPDQPAQSRRSSRSRHSSTCARDPTPARTAIGVLAPRSRCDAARRGAAREGAGGRARHDARTSSCRPIRSKSSPRSRSRATRSSRRSSPKRRSSRRPMRRMSQSLNEVVDRAERSRRRSSKGPGARRRKAPRRRCSTSSRKATPQMREHVADRVHRAAQDSRSPTCSDLLQAQPVTLHDAAARDRRALDAPRTAARASKSLPKGDPNDNETLRKFARAVLAVEPRRDRRADLDPGIRPHHRARLLRGRRLGADRRSRSCSGSCLRRFGDVLLTLVPLLLAGVVTLEMCVDARACRSISPTSSRCRCCSASASRSRSTTSWRGAPGRPTCCSRA